MSEELFFIPNSKFQIPHSKLKIPVTRWSGGNFFMKFQSC